jgi:beta-lactamase class A
MANLGVPLAEAEDPARSWTDVRELAFFLSTRVEDFCKSGDRSVMIEWSGHPGSVVAHKPDVRRPGASLMKLCLVGAMIDLVDRGQLDFKQPITAARFARSRHPSLSRVFDKQHVFSLREVCRLALSTGDNPIATALSDLCTVDDVRAAMLDWGVPAESFTYVAGYTDDELGPLSANNRITARSMMQVLRRFTDTPELRDFELALSNGTDRTRLPALLPAGAKVAHKMGNFDRLANHAGMIEIFGHRIWLVVLAENEPDVDSVDAEIARLAADVAGAITRKQW